MKNAKIKTTGQLRSMLADAATNVLSGALDIEKANTVHKLAKNISESLYSETKIAIFAHDCGDDAAQMGALSIGDPEQDDA